MASGREKPIGAIAENNQFNTKEMKSFNAFLISFADLPLNCKVSQISGWEVFRILLFSDVELAKSFCVPFLQREAFYIYKECHLCDQYRGKSHQHFVQHALHMEHLLYDLNTLWSILCAQCSMIFNMRSRSRFQARPFNYDGTNVGKEVILQARDGITKQTVDGSEYYLREKFVNNIKTWDRQRQDSISSLNLWRFDEIMKIKYLECWEQSKCSVNISNALIIISYIQEFNSCWPTAFHQILMTFNVIQ